MAGMIAAICGLASTDTSALANSAADLRAFVDTYRCEITLRLEQIHAHRRPRDRYLIISPKHAPESYVQCIFVELDTKMLCEAASGFFAQPAGKSRRPVLPPEALASLGRLGFATDSTEGNFQQIISMNSETRLASIADLILSALYQGYGARLNSGIALQAPLGPGGRAALARCVPVS